MPYARVFLAAAVSLALAGRWLCAQQVQSAGARTGSVEGRVLGKDGMPASGLRVALIPVPDDVPRTAGRAVSVLTSIANTDAAGRYVLPDIPPGRYYVVAGRLDDIVHLAQLTVTAGATLTAGDSSLSSPLVYRVRGRLVRERHIAGESILLENVESVSLTFTATAAPDGSFEFANVTPGAYTARVIPDLALPAVEVNVHGDRDIVIPIPLSSVKDIRVEFRTLVEGGGLTPRVRLALAGTSASPKNEVIDIETLEFSQRLPLGQYRISTEAIALASGYSVKSIRAGSTDLMREPLQVAAMGIPPVVITLAVSSPPPWGRVEGKLTGLGQFKVRPNRILMATPELASTLVAEIGPDGGFEFPMALPGTYHVVLSPAPDTYPRTLVVEQRDVTRIEMPAVPK